MKNKITLSIIALVFFGSSDVKCSNESLADGLGSFFPVLERSKPNPILLRSKVAQCKPELARALYSQDYDLVLYWLQMGHSIPRQRLDLWSKLIEMEKEDSEFASILTGKKEWAITPSIRSAVLFCEEDCHGSYDRFDQEVKARGELRAAADKPKLKPISPCSSSSSEDKSMIKRVVHKQRFREQTTTKRVVHTGRVEAWWVKKSSVVEEAVERASALAETTHYSSSSSFRSSRHSEEHLEEYSESKVMDDID
jgi:hypothetical protein